MLSASIPDTEPWTSEIVLTIVSGAGLGLYKLCFPANAALAETNNAIEAAALIYVLFIWLW